MTEAPIKRVTPREAWQVLQDDPDAALLDVRSRVEFDYVGHPTNAINVMWKDYPDWRENPNFVEDVRRALEARGGAGTSRPLLAICRSGARSLAAAQALAAAGYRNLYNIEQGFEGDKDAEGHRGTVNGWRFHGLPWEQT